MKTPVLVVVNMDNDYLIPLEMKLAFMVGDRVDLNFISCYEAFKEFFAVSRNIDILLIDGEKVADELETDASDYLKNDSWAAKYVKDQNKNAVLRFGVSMGIGTELVAKKVITGVGDGVNAVGGWISDGWNYLFN